MSIFSLKLNAKRSLELVKSVLTTAEADSKAAAWLKAAPLLKASKELPEAADGLLFLIIEGAFEREDALEAAAVLGQDHADEPALMGRLGEAFEMLSDMRYLNAAPPDDPALRQIAEALLQLERRAADMAAGDEAKVLRGLGTAARVLGRSWDEVTERCEKRMIALKPDDWQLHYNLGLFFKTRGRFAEGCEANQQAFDRGGADVDSVQWNLGICATGAGYAARALQVWKARGQKIEMGRFGLPEGSYPAAKVLLAERPLAEREFEDEDDPGLEETVWVERISPCHGIIRNALFQDLGVDFGDVVLFDGAPITYHEYQGERIPVFPHLATIARPGFAIYRFGGTQERPKQIAELSPALPTDAVLYPHTEQFQVVCQACWEGGRPHQHDADEPEHRVVTGKLCIPPGTEPAELLAIIDRVVSETSGVQLFIPDLAEAAGDLKRAGVEGRRLEMLSS